MFKYLPMICIFAMWPISVNCASLKIESSAGANMPGKGVAGQKVHLILETSEDLPASSFYRVEVDCPRKPEGAEIKTETGYPESEIVFSKPGTYGCSVDFGILTKSSCAGVNYKELGKFDFNIEIAPE